MNETVKTSGKLRNDRRAPHLADALVADLCAAGNSCCDSHRHELGVREVYCSVQKHVHKVHHLVDCEAGNYHACQHLLMSALSD